VQQNQPPTVSGSRWVSLPHAFRSAVRHRNASVLLETARSDRSDDQSYLFTDPLEELRAETPDQLDRLLQAIDRHVTAGRFVAGYFAYECGEHFVGLSPTPSPPNSRLLAWLGVYQAPVRFDHSTGAIHGSLSPANENESGECLLSPSLKVDGLQISPSDYRSRIARIQQYLAAGHTYQVNFTDRFSGSIDCDPFDLYYSLLRQQPVSFAAYLNLAQGPILSFSPELFYCTSNGEITARPMKGTWPRGTNIDSDHTAAQQLCSDEKNRAEHVTIVDLLRNDVGAVSRPGSVRVDRLMDVERYATLLQMTSTISGRLRPDLTPTGVFRRLFPSGSITGAPKRRTMEIIRELESQSRGIYTGAIGYFAPNGRACFNVAIRTLDIQDHSFSFGVGGGITADSRSEEEYEECHLKAAFLTRTRAAFSLLETMSSLATADIISKHLNRLTDSADYFSIAFDMGALSNDLTAVISSCGKAESRIRIELHQDGAWDITHTPLLKPHWSGRILLASEHTNAADVFLHHKTTNRNFYDRWLTHASQQQFDEALFLNEHAHITEGAISNIFLQINGRWYTPALRSGVLPGIHRQVLIQQLPSVIEDEIPLSLLTNAESVLYCNSLRGVRPVTSIQDENGTLLWRSSASSAPQKLCKEIPSTSSSHQAEL